MGNNMNTPVAAFDRLLRGLISVPRSELEAEERRYEKAKKARAKRPKLTRKKK